jgi:hypothetical protein
MAETTPLSLQTTLPTRMMPRTRKKTQRTPRMQRRTRKKRRKRRKWRRRRRLPGGQEA